MVEKTEEKKEEKKTEAMLSLSSIRRILKEQGIERVSKPALQEIQLILGDIIKDMSRNIIIYTKHAKRKTAYKEDVLLAIR